MRGEQRGARWAIVGLAAALVAVAVTADAGRWTEEDFARRVPIRYRFNNQEGFAQKTVIGALNTYVVEEGDTLLDIARHFDLGYNEMMAANPGIDPWLPAEGEVVVIPTEFVLPDSRAEVVVNIPEMRLYHFHGAISRDAAGSAVVSTYPVGLGRDDWRTPQGKFKIRGKTLNPTWVIPESIRAEHIRDRGDHRTSIAGGDPDNPLGRHRIELTMPLYMLHGTNVPWGVGMQVSHGCIRLYNEDVVELFREVKIGSSGEFLYQPVKVGARDGLIYVEAHPDIYALRGDPLAEAETLLARHGWSDRIDRRVLRKALTDLSGLPVVISTDAAQLVVAN